MTTWRSALADHRAQQGLPADGGETKSLDWLMLGPLPVPVLNIPGRKAALTYHDASHLATGYGVDWRGEFAEAAYELGSGCGKLWVAWVINLQGTTAGLLLCPRITVAAWRRGRASGSFYDHDMSTLLDLPVEDVLARVGAARPPVDRWTANDAALLAAAGLTGAAITAAQLFVGAALIWAPWSALSGR